MENKFYFTHGKNYELTQIFFAFAKRFNFYQKFSLSQKISKFLDIFEKMPHN
jgi:hypothetical protein